MITESSNLPMVSLMIVEDEEPQMKALYKLFSTNRPDLNNAYNISGFLVRKAGNLNEAENLIKENIFDVVLLDLGIPKSDNEEPNAANGEKLLKETIPKLPITGAIVLTHYFFASNIIDALKNGATDIINKVSQDGTPTPDEEILKIVLNCYRIVNESRKTKLMESYEKRNSARNNAEIRQRTDDFLLSANKLIGSIDEKTIAIRGMLSTQLSFLDKEPSGKYLKSYISDIDEAIKKSVNEFTTLRGKVAIEAVQNKINLSNIFNDFIKEACSVAPINRLRINNQIAYQEGTKQEAIVFLKDFSDVIRECVMCAMDHAKGGSTVKIEGERKENNFQMKVTFESGDITSNMQNATGIPIAGIDECINAVKKLTNDMGGNVIMNDTTIAININISHV